MRIVLIALLLPASVLSVEIPARIEVTTPHRVKPGVEFSITLDVSPGSEGKTDYEISEIDFSFPAGISGPDELTYDKPQTAPLVIVGFSAENDGVYILSGTVEANGGELRFTSEPILCMQYWPNGTGTYYAAGLEETLGKSVPDEKASLGVARRFGPEGNVYNEVVIWGPAVEYEAGSHTVTLEMRAEGWPNAYNFVAEALVTQPGDREDEPEIVASRVITGAAFPDDEKYYATSIDFNTYDEAEMLQVRLIYYGYAILYVDRILVK
ncbi:MAG: hypothetical protein GY771_03985 [bacterium]|nr:hypothetical protein [bacterium]